MRCENILVCGEIFYQVVPRALFFVAFTFSFIAGLLNEQYFYFF
ncbi:hypothetical protein U724_03850 [Pseudomonas chlororaphis subsp. aurantiaca PB-St2]|nr:hypothetical protein U724_03850 [Pseudomonas chlororaphis subsp. aurantiaca PB-St2]